METYDRVLDKQIDRSYLERYQEENVDDYINELDEKIVGLQILRDSEDMDIMYGYEYNLISDAIELLRSAIDGFEMRKEGY